MTEEKALKKITIFDKIKNNLKKFLGYKDGKRFIIDTKPYIKKYSQLELANIANIEQKLINALEKNEKEGKLVEGISLEEAQDILEWTVQQARTCLALDSKDGIENDSLCGCCGFSQSIICTILSDMKLSPRVSNVANTILLTNYGIHSFNSVPMPIKTQKEITEKNFLLDATYRQFFTREEVSMSSRFVKDKKFGNKVAPIAGYWCLKIPGGEEFAKTMLSDGFIELTPETAKIYCDSFVLENVKNKEYEKRYKEGITIPVPSKRDIKTGISGEQYIEWLTDEHRQMERLDHDREELDEEIIKTPLTRKKELQKSLNERKASDKQQPDKNNTINIEDR